MIRLWTIAILSIAGVLSAQTSGKTLFDAQCARCHGVGGTGGEGPSLAVPVLHHAADDEALASVIGNGIDSTDMPGNWMLGAVEIETLVRYVRSLSRVDDVPLPGDRDRGASLYQGKGACSVCHIVAGDGGVIGPDLSMIGLTRGSDYLLQSLVAPGETVAESYVVVRATTADQREVTGVRVNEDSFTVQVRDDAGRFHSLDKLSLTTLEKKFGESLMPNYESELSSEELEDIVAYLASLRGE
jgi:putative heme-binding domain-containing protein